MNLQNVGIYGTYKPQQRYNLEDQHLPSSNFVICTLVIIVDKIKSYKNIDDFLSFGRSGM